MALGAAAQAAGLLLEEDPAAVARGWGTAEGPAYEAVGRDEGTVRRIANTLTDAGDLLRRH